MTSMYQRIDCLVRKALSISKNIAICPIGEIGLMTKQILNWRYGVEERYILDNYMKEFNSKIISINDLIEKDTKNLVVILSSINEEVNIELKKQIELLGQNITLINVLDPAVFETENYFEFIKKMRSILIVRGVEGSKKLIRVGRNYDGGYIMLNDFSKDMHAYSFGIADDVSWEKQIASFGIKVFMYDHTISRLPYDITGGKFFRIGISGTDNADGKTLSMLTILEKTGDIKSDNLILKMDVEGAEWDFILNTPSDILENFLQISIEFHSLFAWGEQERILAALSKLNQTHQVIWVHGNNAGDAYKAHELLLPELMEATFVNRKKYKFFSYDTYYIPTCLDMPNLPGRRDLILGDYSGF